MAVGENYTALENAIFECACAGCESIWITVNDDWAPLIKKRVGDYVYDPVWYYRHYDVYGKDSQKLIPIFCVPHMAKYRGRRDSLGWGILNAAIYAEAVTRNMSEILSPNRFYAAFPFGLSNPRELIGARKEISSSRGFYTSYKGKTIKDGARLGFTFTWEDLREINRYINKEGTGVYRQIADFVKGDRDAWSERLPPEEQNSAKSFTLDKVFSSLTMDNSNIYEWRWYYDMSEWAGYKEFMSSEHMLKRPVPIDEKDILHPIGVDDD